MVLYPCEDKLAGFSAKAELATTPRPALVRTPSQACFPPGTAPPTQTLQHSGTMQSVDLVQGMPRPSQAIEGQQLAPQNPPQGELFRDSCQAKPLTRSKLCGAMGKLGCRTVCRIPTRTKPCRAIGKLGCQTGRGIPTRTRPCRASWVAEQCAESYPGPSHAEPGASWFAEQCAGSYPGPSRAEPGASWFAEQCAGSYPGWFAEQCAESHAVGARHAAECYPRASLPARIPRNTTGYPSHGG